MCHHVQFLWSWSSKFMHARQALSQPGRVPSPVAPFDVSYFHPWAVTSGRCNSVRAQRRLLSVVFFLLCCVRLLLSPNSGLLGVCDEMRQCRKAERKQPVCPKSLFQITDLCQSPKSVVLNKLTFGNDNAHPIRLL